ncbi:MAG TPA: DUF6116 family protein [Thermoanaerobaculia bacterium]|nr:DUF6116 family protein [Thermoanaerobaculia bacterium]
MAKPTKGTVFALASRFGRRLRFPQLFTFVLALFLLNVVIPDPIPFIDEILLGLLTVLLGSIRPKEPRDEPRVEPRVEKNVTPRQD